MNQINFLELTSFRCHGRALDVVCTIHFEQAGFVALLRSAPAAQ